MVITYPKILKYKIPPLPGIVVYSTNIVRALRSLIIGHPILVIHNAHIDFLFLTGQVLITIISLH